jgi:hypothetical protein
VLAVISLSIGYVLGYLWTAAALPLGHLLSCFSDTFTKQGVQLFYLYPAWAVSVSNPRRRLKTAGERVNYGCWGVRLWLSSWASTWDGGGITQQISQGLSRPSPVEFVRCNGWGRILTAALLLKLLCSSPVMANPLPCLDSSLACIRTLTEATIAQNSELLSLDQRYERRWTAILLAIADLLNLNPFRLVETLFGGSSSARSTCGLPIWKGAPATWFDGGTK